MVRPMFPVYVLRSADGAALSASPLDVALTAWRNEGRHGAVFAYTVSRLAAHLAARAWMAGDATLALAHLEDDGPGRLVVSL